MDLSILKTESEVMSKWQVDKNKPLVTIFCLTFNHKSFIEQALNGFLIQETDFPFNIFIHDDASTDGTQEVLKRYQALYPNLINLELQKENQYSKKGFAFTYPFFKKMKGNYIALCEGDDYWVDAQKLQKQVSFLEKNSEYVICYTDCQPFDENGLVDKDYGGARKDLTSLELQRATPIFTLTTCFRNLFKEREWPKELNASPYGDLAIWAVLGEYGKGKFLPDIKPSIYRVHSGGVHSSASRASQCDNSIKTNLAIATYKLNKGDYPLFTFHINEIYYLLLRDKFFSVLSGLFLKTFVQIKQKIKRTLKV